MTQAASTPAAAAQPVVVPPPANGGSFRWYFQQGSSVADSLNVVASVGGGANHTFQVDTGSCGIHIGRSHMPPPFDKPDPNRCMSAVTYMPSRITQWGQWTANVPVTLVNPTGTGEPVATGTATVFIVDDPAGYDGGMLGIGYHQVLGDFRAFNPLMNVALAGGARLSPGYIITREYIEVGLTNANQQGFSYANLQQGQGGGWMGPNATVTLSGGPQFPTPVTLDLPLLMDTGVWLMMLFADPGSLPAAFQNTAGALPVIIDDATEVTVNLPLSDGTAVDYTFGAGKKPPEMPLKVQYMGKGSGVNTGIHVLQAFDYLFDGGEQPRMGFRRPLL